MLHDPRDGVVRAPDEQLGELGIRAAVGDAEQVLPEKVARIRDDVLEKATNLPLGVGNERPQVLDGREREAEESPAVVRVAAAQRDGRLLQHEDARGALLARGDGRSKRGVAGADDDDIVLGHGRTLPRAHASLGDGRCRTMLSCRASLSSPSCWRCISRST